MDAKLPPASDVSPKLASIPSRFIALLIDWLVLALPGLVIHFGVPFGGPILLSFLYFPIFNASPLRGTLGKKALGIQVVASSGETVSLANSFVRHLIEVASSCLCFLGHVVAFFTDRRQALHDLVADTIVIEGNAEGVDIWDAWVQTVRRLAQLDPTSAGPIGPKRGIKSRLDELERLHSLREKGVLSEDEYQRLRKDLL